MECGQNQCRFWVFLCCYLLNSSICFDLFSLAFHTLTSLQHVTMADWLIAPLNGQVADIYAVGFEEVRVR